MIFDDGRRMLRLTVIDTGFFDEDMTFELFGDEGEPDADGIRRVPDVKAILERAFGALEDPETNQGHVLHAAWALAEPGDPAHDEAGWRETGGDFHRTTRTLDVGSIGGHRFVHKTPDLEWRL